MFWSGGEDWRLICCQGNFKRTWGGIEGKSAILKYIEVIYRTFDIWYGVLVFNLGLGVGRWNLSAVVFIYIISRKKNLL